MVVIFISMLVVHFLSYKLWILNLKYCGTCFDSVFSITGLDTYLIIKF